MESKEVRNWRDAEALKRFEMIMPLLDPDLDDAKRAQMSDRPQGCDLPLRSDP